MNVARIEPKDLHRHEVSWLLDVCAESSHEWTFEALLDQVARQRMALFRWTGDFTGLMVVMVNSYPGGKEMYIWHLAGKGFLRNIKGVREKTRELARGLGCRWIGAQAKNKALAKIYSQLGRVRGIAYQMEA